PPSRADATEGDARRGPRAVPWRVAARRDVRGARQPDPARPEGVPRAAAEPRRVPPPRSVPLLRPEGPLGRYGAGEASSPSMTVMVHGPFAAISSRKTPPWAMPVTPLAGPSWL